MAITATESDRQPAGQDQPIPTPSAARSRSAARFGWFAERRPAWLTAVIAVLSLFPVILMAARVHTSTKLNYQDYWSAMLRITKPDGSLHLRGLFTYQNEHPFVVPQIVFYLDARLLQGTNRDLGYFAVVMGLLSVLLVWRLMPGRWSPVARALAALASSAVVFCPSGAWNFVRGMSGTAWITANVFALLAVWLAWRCRTVAALLVAGLALITYGTGFGAPVAIFVIAALRRDKRWRWLSPLALLFVALVIYKLTAPGGNTGTGIGHDVALLTQTFLTNLSTLWDPTGGSLGVVLGAGGLVVLVVCFAAYWAERDSLTDLVPWWGVLSYTLTAAVLISLGRSEVFAGDGAQGRYVSLSALFWIALGVVAVRTVRSPRELATRIAVAAGAVAVFWAASPPLYQAAVATNPIQDELAASLRFNATDPFTTRMQLPQQQITRLQGLGNYPFTSDYSFGCGLKPGGSIAMSSLQTLPSSQFDKRAAVDSDVVIGSTRQVSGWIYRPGKPTQCAFFVDSSGKIVGAGTPNVYRNDVRSANSSFPLRTGFQAVVPASESSAQLVLGFADGYYLLPPSAMPAAKSSK